MKWRAICFARAMRIAAAVLLLLFLQQASPTTNRYRAIDEIVRSERERQKIPAVSAAVMINGTIEYSNAFGSADVELNVAATTDTLFRTASVVKPMTAVAAMQLAANAELDLNSPAQKYRPAFPQKPWPITVRWTFHVLRSRRSRRTCGSPLETRRPHRGCRSGR